MTEKEKEVYDSVMWKNKYPLLDGVMLEQLNSQVEKYHTLNIWALGLDEQLRSLECTQAYRYWRRLHLKINY